MSNEPEPFGKIVPAESLPTEQVEADGGLPTEQGDDKKKKIGQAPLEMMQSEKLEAELKAGGFFGKNCGWISCSLAAGLCMGTGSFLYASEYADLGFEGGGLTGPFVFIIFLFIWVRGTVPRLRMDQLMNFAWKFMLPMALINIVVAAIWHYMGPGLARWIVCVLLVGGPYVVLGKTLTETKLIRRRTYRFAE